MGEINVSQSMQQHVKQARDASLAMANIDTSQKNKILHDLAQTLRENSNEILVENAKDMTIANKMLERGELTYSACKRVMLNQVKIDQMAQNCESVATLPVPPVPGLACHGPEYKHPWLAVHIMHQAGPGP